MKRALILRPFDDAGTGKSFKAGQTVDLYDGVFANYAAAGLVRAAPAAPAKVNPPSTPAGAAETPKQGDTPPASEIPPAEGAE